MKLTINIPVDRLYITYLQTINGLLKLSPKEIEILTEFMTLRDKLSSGNIIGEDLSSLLFSPSSRKIIYTKLGISSFNLNNYIASLKAKQLIQEKEGLFYLNAKFTTLVINDNNFEVSFNFKINGNTIQTNSPNV